MTTIEYLVLNDLSLETAFIFTTGDYRFLISNNFTELIINPDKRTKETLTKVDVLNRIKDLVLLSFQKNIISDDKNLFLEHVYNQIIPLEKETIAWHSIITLYKK
jgi:hypothetical protein